MTSAEVVIICPVECSHNHGPMAFEKHVSKAQGIRIHDFFGWYTKMASATTSLIFGWIHLFRAHQENTTYLPSGRRGFMNFSGWKKSVTKHSKFYGINSGQIIIFHQPRFPWNKGISLAKPPFGVRSCEVAIIWPDQSSFFTTHWLTLPKTNRKVLSAPIIEGQC